MKILLVVAGSIALGIGSIGLFVPGLPTTVFVLIAAGCYVRSSDRLYGWLLRHPVYGRQIRLWQEHRAMTRRSKIIALVSMSAMVGLSLFLLAGRPVVRVVVAAVAVVGVVTILLIPTYRPGSERTE